MVSFVTWLFSPFTLALIGLGMYFLVPRIPFFKNRKIPPSKIVLAVLLWLLLCSQPLLVNLVGMWLEAPYPYIDVASQPKCGAIVLLGGGMGAPKQDGDLPEMFGAADRVWHAARLWHAGRAEHIIISGTAEEKSSMVLLLDLGVPRNAIIVESQALNTIGNGIYSYEIICRQKLNKKVLLVTSASHMRRSMMIFKAVGFDPVPAAVDHEATYGGWPRLKDGGLSKWQILPSSFAVASSYIYYKECLGLLGDRVRVRHAIKQHQPGEQH